MIEKNLFFNLFTYRERKQIAPLENYTTEILRYLLERNPGVLKFFTEKCGIGNPTNNISIQSQLPTANGQLDIFVKDDYHKFAIVIENKIESIFSENQIKKYKEYAKEISDKNFVIALVKNKPVFTEADDAPDIVVTWLEFGKFIESEYSRSGDMLLYEFLEFLKEEKMAIDKVEWTLNDGLKAYKNLRNMLKIVVAGIDADKKSKEFKGGNWTVGQDWDICYKITQVRGKNIALQFYHDNATVYLMCEDKADEFDDFDKHPSWEPYRVISKFDLRKEHFFPLNSNEQEEALRHFITDGLEKFKDKKKI